MILQYFNNGYSSTEEEVITLFSIFKENASVSQL